MDTVCAEGQHICKYCIAKEHHPDGFCICKCGARIKVGWREDERDERMDRVENLLLILGNKYLTKRQQSIVHDAQDRTIIALLGEISSHSQDNVVRTEPIFNKRGKIVGHRLLSNPPVGS